MGKKGGENRKRRRKEMGWWTGEYSEREWRLPDHSKVRITIKDMPKTYTIHMNSFFIRQMTKALYCLLHIPCYLQDQK